MKGVERTFVVSLLLVLKYSIAQDSGVNISTSVNTTIFMSTGTPILETTSESSSIFTTQNYPESEIAPESDLSGCSCDIIGNRCDTNCCCDPDCDSLDLVAFTSCLDLAVFDRDDRNCIISSPQDNPLTDNDDESSTTSTNNPSLFCIWRDNYNSRNYYEIPSLAKTNEEFQSLIQSASAQPSFRTAAFNPALASKADSYSTGQFLYYNHLAKVLLVPGSLPSGSECIDFNPVQFLYDRSTTCTRPLHTELSAACESASFPELNPEMVRRELQNGQINSVPVPSRSSNFGTFIVNVIGAETTTYVGGTCHNVLTQMDVEVTHEAGVILSIDAKLTASELPGFLKTVVQQYSLKFTESNRTESVFVRSGNPGYLVGRPVIAGRINASVILLDGDQRNYLTVISPNADGTCLTDIDRRIPVNFGENIRSGCLFQLSEEEVNNVNCEQLRDASRLALLGPTSNIDANGNTDIYIASFGNSNFTRVGDWVPLLSNPFPTRGCSISMHLQILHANVGSVQDPQARIIGARLKFSENSLEFQRSSEATQQFSIVSSVSFIDISGSPEPSLAQKPVSRLRIPADFFQPYYRSSAQSHGSNNITMSMLIGILLLNFGFLICGSFAISFQI